MITEIKKYKFLGLVRHFIFKVQGRVVKKKPPARSCGNILLSYTTLPFTLLSDDQIGGHTQYWEVREIVRLFNEKGYTVDVIDFDNHDFRIKKKYDVFIAVGENADTLLPQLPGNCLKIFHATGAHWFFQNNAEYKRLERIKQKRNTVLVPQRQVKPLSQMDQFDLIAGVCGIFPRSTYDFLKKPSLMCKLSSTHTYEKPIHKNFDSIAKTYLWFGGAGGVHKGLDLVLEAFANMPGYNLVVCGKPLKEVGFAKLYQKELLETSNIESMGYINPESIEFQAITNRCLGIIYPSCSEGCAGSVILAMHSGLIPVVSKESGVETKNFGITLQESTVKEIQETLQRLSSEPVDRLKERALQTWEYVQKNHTRKSFSQEYQEFIVTLEQHLHDK